MSDIEKRLKKLEKQNKKQPLKKFKDTEYESDTRLDPYHREKVSLRDLEELIHEDEDE